MLELDLAEGAAMIDLVLRELEAESVCDDSHEVGCLPKCCVDLLPRHVLHTNDCTEPEA